MTNTAEMTTASRGKHSELIAATALMGRGYSVMFPASPAESFDLAFRSHDNKRTFYVQVKTGQVRQEERYGNEPYLVVKGVRSDGIVYDRKDIDYFIAIYNGKAYMFPNREITEYWCKLNELGTKWERI